MNDVELFLGKNAARDFGLIGADGHVETRAVQTGNGLGDPGQQLEIVGSLDVGGAVHDHNAVAIEQEQATSSHPGLDRRRGGELPGCRASCGTTNQKATRTTKTPPAIGETGQLRPDDKPDQQVGVDDEAHRQRHEGQREQQRCKVDEAPRDASPLGLAMVCGRRHDKGHRQSQGQKGHEVKYLPAFAEVLESLIENRDQLKAEDGLDPRQHHACLIRRMRGLLFEGFAV